MEFFFSFFSPFGRGWVRYIHTYKQRLGSVWWVDGLCGIYIYLYNFLSVFECGGVGGGDVMRGGMYGEDHPYCVFVWEDDVVGMV